MHTLLMAQQLRMSPDDQAMTTPSASGQSNSTGCGNAHTKHTQSSGSNSNDSGGNADGSSEWQHCVWHGLRALQAWQQSLHENETSQAGMCPEGHGGLWDEMSVPELMLELLFMAGLHGEPALVCQQLFLHQKVKLLQICYQAIAEATMSCEHCCCGVLLWSVFL